jgi:hypothetical protein
MLRKYLMALMAGLAFIAIRAEFGEGASTFGGLRGGSYSSSSKDPEAKKEKEYRQRVDAFNHAANHYLSHCRGMKQRSQWQKMVGRVSKYISSAKENPQEAQCEKALDTINNFLEYAKVYYSPHTLKKRIEIQTALRQDAINARQDLKDVEKDVLLHCFHFGEDNYAQVDFGYKGGAECNRKIKAAIAAGSKDNDILREYAYIVAKEKEIARVASIDMLLNNLTLPAESADYKKAMAALKKDIAYFVEVSQQVKRLPWIEYRMTGQPMDGNRVYPGLYKAFVKESGIKANDKKVIEALTQVAHYWNLPAEPSYEDQMAAGMGNKIGEGCSIGWALLRYEAYKAAMKAHDVQTLTRAQKALVVDDALIRCGDRKEKTISRHHCKDMVEKLMPLLQQYKIKVLEHHVKH